MNKEKIIEKIADIFNIAIEFGILYAFYYFFGFNIAVLLAFAQIGIHLDKIEAVVKEKK